MQSAIRHATRLQFDDALLFPLSVTNLLNEILRWTLRHCSRIAELMSGLAAERLAFVLYIGDLGPQILIPRLKALRSLRDVTRDNTQTMGHQATTVGVGV